MNKCPLWWVTYFDNKIILSDTYTYQYDAAGNRVCHSNNVTTTETISYTYDAANRLVESVDLTTSEVTAYDWDDAGRLITTIAGSNVTRVYQYSQDGDLLQADVDGLVTTFAYDGNGQRLQLSIAGETTTFLPDYSGRSNRVLFEQGPEETKQYLYGVACLGEYVTDNATSESEWRYYQRDGATLVRQTTNQTATITLAWTFSPEGGVVLGEEGPVTHLGCQDDAVYDWSTGLIFKGGGYFDPSLGIWLAWPALIVWGTWRPRKRRKKKKGSRKWDQYFGLFLALLLLTVPLTGCEKPDEETPQPTETATCTSESETPVPGQPSETPNPLGPSDEPTMPFNPDALVQASVALEGQFVWKNPTDNDFYSYFVSDVGTEKNINTMNCWESVIFAAYKANQIDKNWIRDFYTTALKSGDPNTSIWQQLGANEAVGYPINQPQPGQLVFFTEQWDPYPGHVALSLGKSDVMSLWNRPNNIDHVQKTTIEALVESMRGVIDVTIGHVPWR